MSEEKHVSLAQKPYAKLLRQYGGILVSLVVLCIIFSVMNPRFMTVANFMNVLQQIAVIAIAAFGMTWVILLGEIDLSIGSIIAVAGMAAAQAFLAGFGFMPTLVLTLLAGAAMGLANGVLTAKLGLPSFIVPISVWRRAISAGVQTAPVATWCSAETTPSTPACRMSSTEHRSFGPNQRQVCRIAQSPRLPCSLMQ